MNLASLEPQVKECYNQCQRSAPFFSPASSSRLWLLGAVFINLFYRIWLPLKRLGFRLVGFQGFLLAPAPYIFFTSFVPALQHWKIFIVNFRQMYSTKHDKKNVLFLGPIEFTQNDTKYINIYEYFPTHKLLQYSFSTSFNFNFSTKLFCCLQI